VRCVVVYSEALQETKEKDVDMEDEQVNLKALSGSAHSSSTAIASSF
jgi:activator of HSP90 ATPase